MVWYIALIMELLKLRQNLQIQKAPVEHGGLPEWMLYDPLTSRYFKMGELEIEFLRHLSDLKVDKVVNIESIEFKEFVAFLSDNNLLVCNNNDLRKNLQFSILKKKQGRTVKALLSQYLSLRVPLFRSDRLLALLISVIRPLLGWQIVTILLACAFTGIYMTVNQWGRFSNTFFEMVSPTGFAYFVIALTSVKILHEFGHGLVAKYYGCYVPTIGVTFLVFWPVLYTDTSSAWLLPSYRQRFLIASAGMLTEIIVAALALFFWHFLPQGGLKSICFLLATTTWILSLLINLNPLMRFDGYFLLADWWKTDNLMRRSLALGQWYFRRCFWGIVMHPPEQPQTRMIVYGWCCTVYRIFLVIGISLVVYHLIYKPLGIVLMVLMIIRSIIKPIFNEVQFLMENSKSMARMKRFVLSIICLLILLLFFVLPVHRSLTFPAVLGGAVSQKIYMPLDGQLMSIENVGKVKEGQQLYQLYLPDLQYQLSEVNREKQRLQWQLNQHSVAGEYLDPRPRIKNELLAVTKKFNQLQSLVAQNHYLATFSGVFQPSDTWLKAGAWVKKGTLLGTLIDQKQARVDAYLPEQERDLLNPISDKKIVGLFYPDNGLTDPVEVLLESIGQITVQQLDHPELASTNGGAINVNVMDNKKLVPATAYYSLRFSSSLPTPMKQISGVILIEGDTYSLISRVWKRIVAVFRKEADL